MTATHLTNHLTWRAENRAGVVTHVARGLRNEEFAHVTPVEGYANATPWAATLVSDDRDHPTTIHLDRDQAIRYVAEKWRKAVLRDIDRVAWAAFEPGTIEVTMADEGPTYVIDLTPIRNQSGDWLKSGRLEFAVAEEPEWDD